MTNPPPRPALRKATDSDIHPAVPRGGLHAVPAPPAPTGGAAVALPSHPPAAGKPGGTIPAWWPGPGAPEGLEREPGGAKKGRTGKAAKAGKSAKAGSGKAAKRDGKKDSKKSKKAAKAARPVEVTVSLPADLHARLSSKAGEHRLSDAEALGELARVWLDG